MNAAAPLAGLRQINLLNPSLLPRREFFSTRSVLAWILIAAAAMTAVAWWATSEADKLRQRAAEQAAQAEAEKNRLQAIAGGGAVPTPQQIAAMEQNLRAKQTQLEARRGAREALKRGMAREGGGPSAILRMAAASIPASAWLTELQANGSRLDLAGKTMDPAAINGWVEKLVSSGHVLAAPAPAVRLDRADVAAAGVPPPRVPTYNFVVTATLARPLADDEGGRRP